MNNLSQKELDLFTNKILQDYDAKNPGTIFKDKIKITNEEALIIQSNVARVKREERRRNYWIQDRLCCKRYSKENGIYYNQHAATFGKVN